MLLSLTYLFISVKSHLYINCWRKPWIVWVKRILKKFKDYGVAFEKYLFYVIIDYLLFFLGTAGCLATLLHDGIMTPADGEF